MANPSTHDFLSTATNTSPSELFRKDVLQFAAYSSARSFKVEGDVWLNANESPFESDNAFECVRKYPESQPCELVQRLAHIYEVKPEQVLTSRGSDEGIDILIRAFCMPTVDKIGIVEPAFGMYRIYAQLNANPVIAFEAQDLKQQWLTDVSDLHQQIQAQQVKLFFLSSPCNPTGEKISFQSILLLAQSLKNQAVIVLDAAYAEFSDIFEGINISQVLEENTNLIILRTLSKAYGGAGLRLGSILTSASNIQQLKKCQAPYPIAQPVTEAAMQLLAEDHLQKVAIRIEYIKNKMPKLIQSLNQLPCIKRVYNSSGNFLLVRFNDAEKAYRYLLQNKIVVRDMRHYANLQDALRISVGNEQECQLLMTTLQNLS